MFQLVDFLRTFHAGYNCNSVCDILFYWQVGRVKLPRPLYWMSRLAYWSLSWCHSSDSMS